MAVRILKILAVWGVLSVGLVGIAVLPAADPVGRAVYGMGMGLIVIWIGVGGALQYRFREPIRAQVRALPGNWRAKFVVLCILLALLEEAVTVTLTNLAPLFGVDYGDAYITASGNYLDVVLFHSVVVFVPMFIAWSWLLSHYDFSPAAVFLLFGLTGTLAESISFGPANLVNVGMWTFVYGLMVYLPAFSLPPGREVRPVRRRHIPLAILAPIGFAVVYILIVWGIGGTVGVEMHPSVHFEPVGE